jgi:hypothetical protein
MNDIFDQIEANYPNAKWLRVQELSSAYRMFQPIECGTLTSGTYKVYSKDDLGGGTSWR